MTRASSKRAPRPAAAARTVRKAVRAGKAPVAGAPAEDAPPAPGKVPFDVHAALARAREAARGKPPAAMFALRDAGHGSVFAQLVGCILSVRTLDEVVLPVALELLGAAPTAEALAALSPADIDARIRRVTFHEPKARDIHAIAVRTVEEFGGELPPDPAVLQSFRGVGPKCAHLALGVATGRPFISVDIHVHRVTNRWGYVHAATPERTLAQLEAKLPREHWVDINAVLVPFGKHVCTGTRPRCSTCPVLDMCRQVGVVDPR